MKKAAEATWSKKDENRQLAAIFLIIAAVIFLSVVIFLKLFNNYNDHVLYAERLKQMQEVTEQLFTGLEDVVNTKWKEAQVQCNYIEEKQPESVEELSALLKKQKELCELDSQLDVIVAIDSRGLCYTENGCVGKIAQVDYLAGKPDRISFVSNAMIGDETRMLILQQLKNPVYIQSGDRKVQLMYAGISYDMKELNPYFNCNAYDGKNCVYVIEDNGLKVFRNSSGEDLIQGYNTYSVLKKMKYLHGSTFESTLEALEKNNTAYSNAVLNGKEYYYALYHMENSAWTLLFMVDSDYVATNTVELVNTTVRMILVFAVVMLVCCSITIFLTLGMRQKQAIAAEKKNADTLEKLNAELDQKNAALAHAVSVAENANQAKSIFLSNMSHDIRTPMNAIVGITNLMAHEKDDPEKLDAYIHKVQSSSQHLLSLINDILDMSKIESSEVKLNVEPMNLGEQIGQIDSIIRPQVENRNQTFIIRVHEIVHEFLLGDAVRIRQVFINLLSNAVKYTQNGGTISLDVSELGFDQPGYARFSILVKDNGYGMSKEFLEHIFEPFVRAENSTTNKIQGTGLGMSITKNIVDLMYGTITVESEVGLGSTFEVVLTLAIDQNIECDLPVHNVLLVTDEEMLTKNVSAALRESGVLLDVVQTSEDAVNLLMEKKFDTILLGGFLNVPSLKDTIKVLREMSKEAVLVLCCDYADKESVYDALKNSGADGLISRPFFLSNFIRAIGKVQDETSSVLEEDTAVLKGKRFLCAEDNELNAEILKAILEMDGADCKIYSNGKEIVDAFVDVKLGDYDAILMDVQMPIMNGLDATRAIRHSSNPLGQTIPIIAMTANAFSSDVQECLDAGMNAHVAKPLDIATLARTLKSLQTDMFFRGGGTTVRLQ